MNSYTFYYKSKPTVIKAQSWMLAMQAMNDSIDTTDEPDGYWLEDAYKQRLWTWYKK